MEIKIGSILLDRLPARRADIALVDGRMICDDHDISPCPGEISIDQARKDAAEMYSGAGWAYQPATTAEIIAAERGYDCESQG